jgi:hypothetical protein
LGKRKSSLKLRGATVSARESSADAVFGGHIKLIFTGRAGAGLCDWESFALLRDNVQHFVEGGVQSGRFAALHSIARAVDGAPCEVDAVRLRLEVLQAWGALWPVTVDGAAVSSRTRAIRRGRPIPASNSVTGPLMGEDEVPFAGHLSEPVPKAAQAFVTTVLSLTNAAVAGDVLEIRRMPGARQPASGSSLAAS